MLNVPMILAAALSSAVFVISPALAFSAQALVLTHATIHDGSGGPPVADGSVVIVGERIRCVGPVGHCRAPKRSRTLDLSGRHVTPGLIDSHVHFSQTGWVDARPEQNLGLKLYDYEQVQRDIRTNPDRWHRAWLCAGITAVFDTGGYPWTLEYSKKTEHDPLQVHVRAAGQLLQLQRMGGRSAMWTQNFLSIETDDEALRQVRHLSSLGSQAVKLRLLDPPKGREQEMADRTMLIGRETDRLGLPLIVHATELRNAKIALRAGADILVHSVEDEPVDDDFVALIKSNNAIYVPTMLVNANWRRLHAGIVLGAIPELDDPNRCVDERTRAKLADLTLLRPDVRQDRRSTSFAFSTLQRAGAVIATEGANLRRLHREGVTIAVGTDSGNALTFHGPAIYAEMEAMEAAGILPSDLIVMATRNGAKAMNRTDIGTLAAGNVADLLILKDNPAVSAKAFRTLQTVIRAGVMHTPAQLASAR